MRIKGMFVDDGTIFDGDVYRLPTIEAVDWTDPDNLRSAIFQSGPVKLCVDANKFEDNICGSVTPGQDGWAMFNYPHITNFNHCVSLCGYGKGPDLAKLIKEYAKQTNFPDPMPDVDCFAMFTWNSIGIVDYQSILNMTGEAWVRRPVTREKLKSVSTLKLINNSATEVDIHAIIWDPSKNGEDPIQFENEYDNPNYENFPINQSRTMNLSEKCDMIKEGWFVRLKVWVRFGPDPISDAIFVYHKNGPMQVFSINGPIWSLTLTYEGERSVVDLDTSVK